MNYIGVLTLLLLSTVSNADLKPLGLGDLDAFVSKIPDFETQSIQHSYNVQANFSIGSTGVDYKTCSRHSKRKANTFLWMLVESIPGVFKQTVFYFIEEGNETVKYHSYV